MAIGLAIFFLLLATATLQSAAFKLLIIGRTPEEYLQLPSAEFHERVGKAMLELATVLESNEHVGDTCLDTSLRIAVLNNTMEDGYREIYQNLLDFSDLYEKCSKEQIDTYISLMRHLKAGKVPKLSPYFSRYVHERSEKIYRCAKRENERLSIAKFELDCVNKVFKKAFDLSESSSTEKLLSAVSRFTTSESEFSARAMLAKAKECAGDARLVEKPLDILAKFMVFLCEKIHDKDPSMVSAHNILGMARIFSYGYWWEFKPEVHLLNEYHRICMAWSREESRQQFKNNLIKQMDKLIDWFPKGRKRADNCNRKLSQTIEGLKAAPGDVIGFVNNRIDEIGNRRRAKKNLKMALDRMGIKS
jgi:hypothetical protein